MANPKKIVRNAQSGLTEKQRNELQEEMRNNQALGKRASVAANLLPTVIRTYPFLSEKKQVAKATRLADLVMKDLLGITFTKNEEKPESEEAVAKEEANEAKEE